MFSLPAYRLNEFKNEYLEEKRIDSKRSEELMEKVEKSFLTRKENFYEDNSYKKEFEKLQMNK